MPPKLEQRVMKDVEIMFRNFSGVKGMYNEEGQRSFVLLLDEETALEMEHEGWNVKWTKPREGYEDEFVLKGKLQVSLSYPPKARKGPRCVMITSRNKTVLPEDLVGLLDFVNIKRVDLILNPYAWRVREDSGIKAYLDSIYITIVENELELMYADLEEIEAGGMIEGEVIGEYTHEDTRAIGR